jgi:DNA-directed RNA polymerase subunit N (RpoN/RPB10)
MKVNCLFCGHKVELDDAYDDYEGPIRCFVCGTQLEIRTEEGNIRSVKLAQAVGTIGNANHDSQRRAGGRAVKGRAAQS